MDQALDLKPNYPKKITFMTASVMFILKKSIGRVKWVVKTVQAGPLGAYFLASVIWLYKIFIKHSYFFDIKFDKIPYRKQVLA